MNDKTAIKDSGTKFGNLLQIIESQHNVIRVMKNEADYNETTIKQLEETIAELKQPEPEIEKGCGTCFYGGGLNYRCIQSIEIVMGYRCWRPKMGAE